MTSGGRCDRRGAGRSWPSRSSQHSRSRSVPPRRRSASRRRFSGGRCRSPMRSGSSSCGKRSVSAATRTPRASPAVAYALCESQSARSHRRHCSAPLASRSTPPAERSRSAACVSRRLLLHAGHCTDRRTGFGQPTEVPGRDKVVVLSHALWRERFGGRREVVARRSGSAENPTRSSGSCRTWCSRRGRRIPRR